MKVFPTVQNKVETKKGENYLPAGHVQKNRVSFAGRNPKMITSGFFDWVERKGFFADFLIVDTLSMIIPRIFVGLNRDKDKTGKTNYKAGAEEAGREILSGPSMFLIPMGIFSLVRKFNPATKIPQSSMTNLNNVMIDTMKKSQGSGISSVSEANKKLAGEIFDTAFEKFELTNREGLKKRFVSLLAESTGLKSKDFSTRRRTFEKLVDKINRSNMVEGTFDSQSILVGKQSITPKSLMTDFKNYSNDVIQKFVSKDFVKNVSGDFVSKSEKFFEGIIKNRTTARLGLSVVSFLAVGAFLKVLPKVYQMSNVSPAQDSANRASGKIKEGGKNENK